MSRYVFCQNSVNRCKHAFAVRNTQHLAQADHERSQKLGSFTTLAQFFLLDQTQQPFEFYLNIKKYFFFDQVLSRRHEMFRHMKKIHGYQSGDDDNEAGTTGDVSAAGDAGDVRVTKQEQHEEEEEEQQHEPLAAVETVYEEAENVCPIETIYEENPLI